MRNGRSMWSIGITVAALLAALPPTTAVADAGPTPAAGFSAARQSEAYLFTVQAVAGSTVTRQTAKGEDERFTLTLTGVDPVTKFADRPFTDARVMSPKALATNWNAWFRTAPPNAVLTYAVGQGKAPQSIVVTLTNPKWNATNRALTFTAVRIYRTLDPSAKGKNWNRPATPTSFTTASLFIDDATDPCAQPSTFASCAGADLSGLYLSGTSFASGNYSGANLSGTDLSNANLVNVDFTGADLSNANLSGADLSYSTLTNANLAGANLTNAALVNATAPSADFTGANFTNARLANMSLTGANLTNANFTGAYLNVVDMTGATYTGANFSGATAYDSTGGPDLSGSGCTDGWATPCI